jgi:hypothetical protein
VLLAPDAIAAAIQLALHPSPLPERQRAIPMMHPRDLPPQMMFMTLKLPVLTSRQLPTPHTLIDPLLLTMEARMDALVLRQSRQHQNAHQECKQTKHHCLLNHRRRPLGSVLVDCRVCCFMRLFGRQ